MPFFKAGNYIDEFTGRPPSEEAIWSANKAWKYFMGELGFFGKLLAGAEMPPKAEERGITMEKVRDYINEEKSRLKKQGKKY